MDSKPFWYSRTLWGGVMLVLALILGKFGVELGPDEQASFIDQILGVIEPLSALVGSVLVVVGRFKAKKAVTLK